jgi:hypothetical protein
MAAVHGIELARDLPSFTHRNDVCHSILEMHGLWVQVNFSDAFRSSGVLCLSALSYLCSSDFSPLQPSHCHFVHIESSHSYLKTDRPRKDKIDQHNSFRVLLVGPRFGAMSTRRLLRTTLESLLPRILFDLGMGSVRWLVLVLFSY